MDPRIGMFCSEQGMFGKGQFYCYPNADYSQDPVSGTLAECELALGLEPTQVDPTEESNELGAGVQSDGVLYTVRLWFTHPAWDERDGIPFHDIAADSKREANSIARDRAEREGHLTTGKGRYWFTAQEQ